MAMAEYFGSPAPTVIQRTSGRADKSPSRVGGRDDNRTPALLILASGVDANPAAPATAWCSRATIRSLMIMASEGRHEGRSMAVSCDRSIGWRHADRDQFGPRIRLR